MFIVYNIYYLNDSLSEFLMGRFCSMWGRFD